MANPLARTILNNIAKKSLNKNDTQSYTQCDNSSYEKSNENRNITLKRLDRVAEEIRESRNIANTEKDTYKKEYNLSGNVDKNNLSLKELSLLSNVIKGNVEIERNTKPSNGRNILSLDRLAKNIKENS